MAFKFIGRPFILGPRFRGVLVRGKHWGRLGAALTYLWTKFMARLPQLFCFGCQSGLTGGLFFPGRGGGDQLRVV